MSVVIEIKNTAKLKRARAILGAKSNIETLELALDMVVEGDEPDMTKQDNNELPESFWDDLFSQPQIPSSVIIKAVEDEREDRF
jgi:hypothetical protein